MRPVFGCKALCLFLALGLIVFFSIGKARASDGFEGFYTSALQVKKGYLTGCFGGLKNPDVLSIRNNVFIPQNGAKTGEKCNYAEVNELDKEYGIYVIPMACPSADSEKENGHKMELQIQGFPKELTDRLRPFGVSAAASTPLQHMSLDRDGIKTDFSTRKCNYEAEIESSVGQLAEHLSLTFGEKTAVLYGYYEAAIADCQLPPIEEKISSCFTTQIAGMMHRDFQSFTEEQAQSLFIKRTSDGKAIYLIDRSQIPLPNLCTVLSKKWRDISKGC